MKISKIRSTSLGIEGSYKNIDHHAQNLRGIAKYLERSMPSGFLEWKQGHNVHLLITHDERTFVIRPLRIEEESYVGLRLFCRISRSVEIPLVTVYHDERNGVDWHDFSRLLAGLAETPEANSNEKDDDQN